jgi:hypothetical protein
MMISAAPSVPKTLTIAKEIAAAPPDPSAS